LIPKTLHWILSTLVLVGKSWMDTFITWYIGVKLGQVQEEHRIEGLVNLLRGKHNFILVTSPIVESCAS